MADFLLADLSDKDLDDSKYLCDFAEICLSLEAQIIDFEDVDLNSLKA